MPARKYFRIIFKRKGLSKKDIAVRISILAVLTFLFFGATAFIYYGKDLPRPEKFTERQFFQSTKIYDRTGTVLLYDIYGEEKRTIVPLSQVPDSLKNAVLAAEDSGFYSHAGLSFKGIARSTLNNIKAGKATYGASTITQQLIRASFLTPQKTLSRKIKEIVLTLEMERRYSKDQILEFYFNQIPFGGNAYGVEAAAQTYFQKSASQLTVAESATLAALIKAPSFLSPYGTHTAELLGRKDYVLGRMQKLGFLSEEDYEKAKKEEIKFSQISQPIKAPHFVNYVRDLLEQKYSEDYLKTAGLKVYTSLDWDLQKYAEETVEEVSIWNKAYNANNAALVSISPKTGEILAMVGSKDWFATESFPKGCSPGKDCLFEPKYNVATSVPGRQPGSAFKPFAYAVAFNKGYSPNTVLVDEKTEFNPNCNSDATQEKDQYDFDCYHPNNYDGNFRGPVALRDSLAQSLNIPSIKVLLFAGIQDTLDLAKTMGITTLGPASNYGPALVLGGGEVKLLDLVSAYGVFANDGLKIPPVAILKIENSRGDIIEINKKTPQRILDANTARLINDVLSDNDARTPIFGPNSLLYFPGYQVAAKTGTTQDYKDGWAIGYAPNIVTGVWVGNNDNTLMNKEPGVVLAGPIFHRVMAKALSGLPAENFTKAIYNSSQGPEPTLNSL